MAARPLPVTAVLFDLDGTLADSAGDLASALNRVRGERGLPPVPMEKLRGHASSGARGLLYAGMGVTPEHGDYDALRDAGLYFRRFVAPLRIHGAPARLLRYPFAQEHAQWRTT